MEIVPNVSSHTLDITPSASDVSDMSSTSSILVDSENSWVKTNDKSIVPKTIQPVEEGPVSPLRKTRGFFRTYSSNSLHILLSEVVLPVYSADYMKILPPPSTIYLKTVEGTFVQKHVFMNEDGDRYIIDENSSRVYLQDIKGLYRYNSA